MLHSLIANTQLKDPVEEEKRKRDLKEKKIKNIYQKSVSYSLSCCL